MTVTVFYRTKRMVWVGDTRSFPADERLVLASSLPTADRRGGCKAQFVQVSEITPRSRILFTVDGDISTARMR